MNQDMTQQEMASATSRAEFELKYKLQSVRKRKLATGERTPAIEAVRRRLMDERRGECDG